MRALLICVSAILVWPSYGFAGSSPQDVAMDFCHAVAAQALCGKYLVMDRSVEMRMEQLAGGKLRGKASPLNPVCEAGYTEYYKAEDTLGRPKACAGVLAMFGPGGARRAGLVSPRAAPAMKMPEADIAEYARDICYAAAVAKDCPDISLVRGIEVRLDSETGVKLRAPGGYFSSECESGVFRASLAKGKTGLPQFCARSLAAFGQNGVKHAGLLSGPQPATAKPAASAPVRPIGQVQSAPTAAPQYNLVILLQLPPLPAGKTPSGILGAVPGTLGAEACRAVVAKVTRSGENLRAAKTFAAQTERAIFYAADVKAASTLCPSVPAGKLPDTVLTGAINTGLDACPIVLETLKKLNDVSSDYRKKSMYRGMFGVSEAKIWALEALIESCSRYTKNIMKSTLKYTRKNAERERKSYTCRLWQNLFYEEMKKVRALGSKNAVSEAIELLDSRAAAAIHGQRAACEKPSYAGSSEKQWLSSRKYLQIKLGRN